MSILEILSEKTICQLEKARPYVKQDAYNGELRFDHRIMPKKLWKMKFPCKCGGEHNLIRKYKAKGDWGFSLRALVNFSFTPQCGAVVRLKDLGEFYGVDIYAWATKRKEAGRSVRVAQPPAVVTTERTYVAVWEGHEATKARGIKKKYARKAVKKPRGPRGPLKDGMTEAEEAAARQLIAAKYVDWEIMKISGTPDFLVFNLLREYTYIECKFAHDRYSEYQCRIVDTMRWLGIPVDTCRVTEVK